MTDAIPQGARCATSLLSTMPPHPMPSLTLLLAGDVMTGRGIDQILPHPVDPLLHEPWVRDAREYVRLAEAANGPVPHDAGLTYPWGEALAIIATHAPRWRFVNLETAITERGAPWPRKGIHYRMCPRHIGVLQAARLDACVLANNHALDWGPVGLEDTLQALRAAGIAAVGAGADEDEAWRPACWPLDPTAPDGARLRLHACATPDSGVPAGWAAGPRRAGIALLPRLDDDGVRRLTSITRRDRRAGDVDLWSLHWGGNWVADVPPAQRRFARALIDTGAAALVHGHSSHHPMPLDLHRGHLVLHGCGDLINDYEGIGPGPAARGSTLRADLGCLYIARLDASDGRLRALEVVALQRRRLRLQAATAEARAATARLLGGAWSEGTNGLRLLNAPGAAATEHVPCNVAADPAGPAAIPGIH